MKTIKESKLLDISQSLLNILNEVDRVEDAIQTAKSSLKQYPQFRAGDNVKILANESGHELEIGESYVVANIIDYDYYEVYTSDFSKKWAVMDDEIEMVQEFTITKQHKEAIAKATELLGDLNTDTDKILSIDSYDIYNKLAEICNHFNIDRNKLGDLSKHKI